MDFKNSFVWLTALKKLIFDCSNFFGSSHISIIFADRMDRKMVGAKKVEPINHAKEFLKSIHTGVVFLQFFGQSFKWPPLLQEIIFNENWLV